MIAEAIAHSLLDDVVEGADDLLHGRSDVRTVRKDDVDIVELQPLEGGVHALDNVLRDKKGGPSAWLLALRSHSAEYWRV